MRSAACALYHVSPSPFTRRLTEHPDCPQWMYRPDLFHNFHVGHGRSMVASCLVVLLPLFACRLRNERPVLSWISPESLDYLSFLHWPSGGWQKGAATTQFLEHHLSQPDALADVLLDQRVRLILLMVRCVSSVSRKLYEGGYWLRGSDAASIAADCRRSLRPADIQAAGRNIFEHAGVHVSDTFKIPHAVPPAPVSGADEPFAVVGISIGRLHIYIASLRDLWRREPTKE